MKIDTIGIIPPSLAGRGEPRFEFPLHPPSRSETMGDLLQAGRICFSPSGKVSPARVNTSTSESSDQQPETGAGCVVTLCTYNDTLPCLLSEILTQLPESRVLVVDDSSPDGTGELADSMAATDPRILVHHRHGVRGLGTATLYAFQAALKLGGEFLVNLDADFSHHPRHLRQLLRTLRTSSADVAIGSRYVQGGKIVGWPIRRHVMSRCINTWARMWMHLSTRDCSGSYRCYRMALLRRIDFSKFRSHGYAVQEELLYRCARAGATFVEVPITFEDRLAGESKINLKEALTAVAIIARCGMER